MCYEAWKLVADFGTAVGTIAVAYLAVYGDRVRSKLFAPKFEAGLVNPKGDLTIAGDGRKVRYFHLTIANATGRNVATNCRVILREVQRADQKGDSIQFRIFPC